MHRKPIGFLKPYRFTLTIIKSKVAYKQLYEQMVAKGKNKKLALIAICNKLLKQVLAVVNKQTMFDNNY